MGMSSQNGTKKSIIAEKTNTKAICRNWIGLKSLRSKMIWMSTNSTFTTKVHMPMVQAVVKLKTAGMHEMGEVPSPEARVSATEAATSARPKNMTAKRKIMFGAERSKKVCQRSVKFMRLFSCVCV